MQRAHNECNADGGAAFRLLRFHAPFGQRWPRANWADDKGSPRPDDEEVKVRFIAELARLAERAGVSIASPSESTRPFILAQRPARTSLSEPLAYRFPV